MKKVLLIILSLILCLAFSGCKKTAQSTNSDSSVPEAKASVFAEMRTYDNSGAAEKRNLANTYSKLTNENKLNVVYIGGSVTQGAGSSEVNWRLLTGKWLKEKFPSAEINTVNSAINATGTYWGLFRSERDIIEQSPDLVFIEFAINDHYQGFQKVQSAVFMESIIRKVNSECPNTDIIIILTTDQSNMGIDYDQLKAHQEVADYYGIPCINVANALKAEIDSTGNAWEYYVMDIVHPNPEGHKVYAAEIEKYLDEQLIKNPSSASGAHKLPEKTYVSRIYNSVDTITCEKIPHDDKWKEAKSSSVIEQQTKLKKGLVPQEDGAQLTYEFEGVSFGMAVEIRDKTKLTCTIDGDNTVVLEPRNEKGEVERLIYDNLTEGKHTVTITYSGKAYLNIAALFVGK